MHRVPDHDVRHFVFGRRVISFEFGIGGDFSGGVLFFRFLGGGSGVFSADLVGGEGKCVRRGNGGLVTKKNLLFLIY